MIRPLRKTLNVLVSLSLAIPSAGLAQPAETPATPQVTDEMTAAAEAYNLKFANLEQTGPGQIRGTLAPDRYLLMEQTVYRKEIPVVRTFVGHIFRKWRLNALITKTGQYAVRLPDAHAQLTPEETISFAKSLLPMYANMVDIKKSENPIKKEVIDVVIKIGGAGALADALLKLMQIHPGRKDEIHAIADGEQRLDATVTALVDALAYDHVNNGRRVDTPLFLWDSQRSAGRLNRIAEVLEHIQQTWSENKNAGVMNETDAPYERRTRFINWWDTSIQIQDDERVLETLNLRDTTAGVDTSGKKPFSCASEKCRFNIVQGDTVLHTFGLPTAALATFDQFVVFSAPADMYDGKVEAQADAEAGNDAGVQYLMFLDLKTYTGLLGNEDIPVFRLPVRMNEPITKLEVRDGVLAINDKYFFERDFIKEASERQQIGFNLTNNLLNPDSWSKVLPVVDSVEEYFSKSINGDLQNAVNEKNGLKRASVAMEQIGKEIQAELDAQKKIEPLKPKQAKALNDAVEATPEDKAIESVRLYHKRVKETGLLDRIAQETMERTRISRKFNARMRLMVNAMISPRPFASQKIKEALGSWYVRREDGKTSMMDRLLNLTNRQYVNAGVIGAGIWAAVAPDSFHQMVNLGLSVGTMVYDYVVFAQLGIGEASVAGTGATFAPFTDLTTVPRQYFWDGALGRTMIAIPALLATLAGLYFAGHFTFNLIQLRKDLKKPGIKGFIDRQEKFKEEYYARLAADEGEHRDVGAVDEKDGKKAKKKIEFTPEEDSQIQKWTIERRAEIREGGIFKRLGSAISKKFNRMTSLAVSPFKALINASLESQNESMLQAMIAADESTAIQKGSRQTPIEHAAFWTAFRNNAIGGVFGNVTDKMSAAMPAPVGNAISATGDAVGKVRDTVVALPGQAAKYSGAVKDLTLSLPALELTLEHWVRKWNTWAMWRFATFEWAKIRVLGTDVPYFPMKVKPISFASKVLYPEFMNTVVLRRTGERVLPTDLNGGLYRRSINPAKPFVRAGRAAWNGTKSFAAKLKAKIVGAPEPDMYDGPVEAQADAEALDAQQMMEAMENSPKAELAALKKFEDQIIDVEKEISEIAFRKALEGLAEHMTDKSDLQKLFGANGISDIVQKDIHELSWKSQTYIRAHYESSYNAAMTKFLNGDLARREAEAMASERTAPAVAVVDVPDMYDGPIEVQADAEAAGELDATQQAAQDSLVVMKQKIIKLELKTGKGLVEDYGFDLEQAKADARSVMDDIEHVHVAEAAVAQGRMSVSNFLRNTKYSLIATYDPTQNQSIARVEVVHRRLQSPGALSRAVRAEVAKLLLTVPIELSARLLFTAGIFEGAMKPIQEEFFGPNSIAYGSLTSFYMIFASGFVMSMMADAWVKIQQDARQDESGEFGQIPQGEDAEKSFLRWYFKQFNAKENSLLKNWAQSNQIAFWNMPAALANIMLFWFMFSGRFDLSLLMAGYVISFGTPISAFHQKVDQAFERAVHFAARGIKDEKWMAHPEVQKVLIPEMQKSRFRFTLFNDAWSTIQGDWVGNIEFIPTSLGTRGFQRAIFGGGLLEEYIINGALKPVSNAVTGIPVLEHVVKPVLKGCEYLLSNNNPDLKITK